MHPGNTRHLRLISFIFVAIILSSCNTVPTNENVAELPVEPENISFQPQLSERIFPKTQLNTDNEWLPYRAAENPYDLIPAPTVSPETIALFKSALRAKKNNDLTEAQKLFASVTEQSPNLSGPWVQLGNIAAENLDWELAEAAYTSATTINEWNNHAWLGMGLAYRQQGNMDKAKESYEQALKHWPDNADAHKNLAILLDVYLNQPELAQPHFEAFQILTQFSNDDANNWVVEIQRRTGKQRLMPHWVAPSVEQPTTPAEPEEVDA